MAPDRILLFVHGATHLAESAFDLKLERPVLMDYIAERGYMTYLVTCAAMAGPLRPGR